MRTDFTDTSGKEKCEILRDIRIKIANANGIYYVPAECKHAGNCAGTCPLCDSEAQYILKELQRIRKQQGRVKLVGLVADDFADEDFGDNPDDYGANLSMGAVPPDFETDDSFPFA